MKRKYAAIVLGLTMTLTTANISAVNIMAATASTAEEKQTKSEDSDSSQSEKENKSDSDNQEDGNEKQSEGEAADGEKPDGEPPEKPEGQEPNGGQGAPGEQSNGVESYEAVNDYTEDVTVENETVSSTGTDENAIHVSQGASAILKGISVDRESEDSKGGDTSSFYGGCGRCSRNLCLRGRNCVYGRHNHYHAERYRRWHPCGRRRNSLCLGYECGDKRRVLGSYPKRQRRRKDGSGRRKPYCKKRRYVLYHKYRVHHYSF